MHRSLSPLDRRDKPGDDEREGSGDDLIGHQTDCKSVLVGAFLSRSGDDLIGHYIYATYTEQFFVSIPIRR